MTQPVPSQGDDYSSSRRNPASPPSSSSPVVDRSPESQLISQLSPVDSEDDDFVAGEGFSYREDYTNGNGVSHEKPPAVDEHSIFTDRPPSEFDRDYNLAEDPLLTENGFYALPEASNIVPTPTPATSTLPAAPPERFESRSSAKEKSYSEVDPDTSYRYAAPRRAKSSHVSQILLVVIASGFLILLTYLVYSRIKNPAGSDYEYSEETYGQFIARGDSLFIAASNFRDAGNHETARATFNKALENYMVAQHSSQIDDEVRDRIKQIQRYNKEQSSSRPLDAKASLAYMSSGDSLMRIAEALVLQGDSLQATALYREARDKYFQVYEAFPDDSLVSARLRRASERLTAPVRITRSDSLTRPPEVSPEQLKQQLFATFKAEGDSALAAQDYEAARRKFLAALDQNPNAPEVTQKLAEIDRQLEETQRMGQYRQHIRDGNTMRAAGRLAEARRSFELALEIVPNARDAEKAIFEIDSYLNEQARREQNYQSHRARGDLLLEQNKYDEALASYEAALNAKPDDEYAKIKIDETRRNIDALREHQSDLPEGMVDENGIYNYTEEPPELIGGRDVLQARIRYPARAREAGVEGRVAVQMIVDETGRMTDPKIVKSLGFGCDQEVLRVMRGARFEPGRVGGVPVPSRHTLFFDFMQ